MKVLQSNLQSNCKLKTTNKGVIIAYHTYKVGIYLRIKISYQYHI